MVINSNTHPPLPVHWGLQQGLPASGLAGGCGHGCPLLLRPCSVPASQTFSGWLGTLGSWIPARQGLLRGQGLPAALVPQAVYVASGLPKREPSGSWGVAPPSC